MNNKIKKIYYIDHRILFLSLIFYILCLPLNLNAKINVINSAKVKNENQVISKDIRFDEHLVNGKYQIPGEGLVTVENEKQLINVLSIRNDFADRIKNENGRR